jgi:hypothetical protein
MAVSHGAKGGVGVGVHGDADMVILQRRSCDSTRMGRDALLLPVRARHRSDRNFLKMVMRYSVTLERVSLHPPTR